MTWLDNSAKIGNAIRRKSLKHSSFALSHNTMKRYHVLMANIGVVKIVRFWTFSGKCGDFKTNQ